MNTSSRACNKQRVRCCPPKRWCLSQPPTLRWIVLSPLKPATAATIGITAQVRGSLAARQNRETGLSMRCSRGIRYSFCCAEVGEGRGKVGPHKKRQPLVNQSEGGTVPDRPGRTPGFHASPLIEPVYCSFFTLRVRVQSDSLTVLHCSPESCVPMVAAIARRQW